VNGNTASFGSLSVNPRTLGGTGIVGNTTITRHAGAGRSAGNLSGTLTVQGQLSFTAASTT